MCVSNTRQSVQGTKELTTIPRTGFNARFAIPVLNEREVMSRIAVPVVSEPVPAVVGMAIKGRRA